MKTEVFWFGTITKTLFPSSKLWTSSFYQSLGLDTLKDGVGAPGLTLKYLSKTLPSDVYFSLIDENQKDLHQLLRDEMVGGPSVIFHRYHEKGLTQIREPDRKLVSSLEGFDANGLHLWTLMQQIPTGLPTIRKKRKQFQGRKSAQIWTGGAGVAGVDCKNPRNLFSAQV